GAGRRLRGAPRQRLAGPARGDRGLRVPELHRLPPRRPRRLLRRVLPGHGDGLREDGPDRGEHPLGPGVRGDHHEDHRRSRQSHHRRRGLSPGLMGLPAARPRIGVVNPYWTLWEHTAGPTFRADRMALARSVADELSDTIDPVAVDEIASG